MIVVSWNCRGLGARVKRSQVRKYSHTHNPSFIFIQETKCESLNPKLIKSIWSDDDVSWFSSPSIGNSGGLLSLWKQSFFIMESCRVERSWIALSGIIPSHDFHCIIVNIYNPCSIEGRAEVWESITEFWKLSNLPILIIGDFNEVLSPHERGSQNVSQEGVADFSNFIQSVELMEILPSNGTFTWFHGSRKSKLDRCLANPEWVEKFPNLFVSLLNRTISDHCPLLLQSSSRNWGPKPFRFMNCWISHPSYLPLIRQSWEKASNLPVTEKLKLVKADLRDWNKTKFGLIDENIKNLEEKIQHFDSIANERHLDDIEIQDQKKAQLDLWTWLKRKESYWAQNSRSKWIKEGDRNTKFFHTMASVRRRKNVISPLLFDKTNCVDIAGIKKEAVSYFRNIFKEEINSRPRFENLDFKHLLPSQISMLTEPFTHKEIDLAVASCEGNKAPGPDGLNFNFIKSAWEVIKHDIYDMVEKFWATSHLPKGCNTAFVALIPKIESPSGFKDFRPISMVGCIYKIISKLLARRLQQVMDHLVGPLQSSFIEGRQILDGALIAGEIIESCKRHKTEATMLKLDFHKAFDSISWGFLDWVHEQMGFPLLWRAWIKSCVMTASASILINGSPTHPVKLHRGLRQGDPLSPFLFNLAVETLNLILKKGLDLGLWDGIATRPNGVVISHLQYADDTIIFCPPKVEFLCNIKKTLIAFHIASGLGVNFHKSALYGINVDELWLSHTADLLLCRTGSLPFTYLGLPIGGNISRRAAWEPVIDRMKNKLAAWNGKLLSIGGRLTLIKASLSSLPLYFMSLFPIPKGIIDCIVKIQRNFLWNGTEKKNHCL